MVKSTRILVCDDDIHIADVIKVILEGDDIDVAVEYNSSKLLDRIYSKKPNILIIDLWMPQMQGDEIIKCLRSSKEYDDLIIISMSASFEGEHVCRNAGANAFISKPFNIDDMISKVHSYIYT